ncbi:MAG: XRE family transcriptional regulator [Verrucomicrobiota bacterium]
MTPDTQEENSEILRAFSWRLQNCASAKKLEQIDIAEKLGVSLSRVGNWFQGRNFPRRIERPRLANLLDITVEYLIHGTAENGRITPVEVQESQASYGGPPVRDVPLISWSHAGEAVVYEEMPRHFQGRVSTTSADPRAFAVTVEGDSMEPKVFAGDRVVCEPTRQPINGKPVVAKHRNEEVQLRLYHKLPNGRIRLAPLNPVYPTIEYEPDGFMWIYPVLELVRRF